MIWGYPHDLGNSMGYTISHGFHPHLWKIASALGRKNYQCHFLWMRFYPLIEWRFSIQGQFPCCLKSIQDEAPLFLVGLYQPHWLDFISTPLARLISPQLP